MAQILYVWIGTTLTARVTIDNPVPMDLPAEVHLTVATFPERVETIVVPAGSSITQDFPGYIFEVAGVYPAAGYVSEPGNPANVYAALVAERSLEVLETQLVATVDWV